MAGSWSNTYQSSLTIPTGATSGARIVIDGITGLISVYNASDLLVDTIGGPFGDIISYATGLTLDVALSEGSIEFGTASSGFAGAGSLTGDLTSGGGLLLSTGTGDATHDDALEIVYRAGDTGQSSGSSTAPKLIVGDAALSSAADMWITGSVIAADIATQAKETWHAPSYKANWSGTTAFLGLGGPTLQYRRMGEDDTWIYGLATTAAGAGTTVFQLPSGYYAASGTVAGGTFPCMRNRGGTLTVLHCAIDSSNGAVIVGAATAAGDQYSWNTRIPCGHVP